MFLVFFYSFHDYKVYADDISFDNNQLNTNTIDSTINKTEDSVNNTIDSSVYIKQTLNDDTHHQYQSTCLHESREKYLKKEGLILYQLIRV